MGEFGFSRFFVLKMLVRFIRFAGLCMLLLHVNFDSTFFDSIPGRLRAVHMTGKGVGGPTELHIAYPKICMSLKFYTQKKIPGIKIFDPKKYKILFHQTAFKT